MHFWHFRLGNLQPLRIGAGFELSSPSSFCERFFVQSSRSHSNQKYKDMVDQLRPRPDLLNSNHVNQGVALRPCRIDLSQRARLQIALFLKSAFRAKPSEHEVNSSFFHCPSLLSAFQTRVATSIVHFPELLKTWTLVSQSASAPPSLAKSR